VQAFHKGVDQTRETARVNHLRQCRGGRAKPRAHVDRVNGGFGVSSKVVNVNSVLVLLRLANVWCCFIKSITPVAGTVPSEAIDPERSTTASIITSDAGTSGRAASCPRLTWLRQERVVILEFVSLGASEFYQFSSRVCDVFQVTNTFNFFFSNVQFFSLMKKVKEFI
jgi:hypothetical protein